MIDKKIKMNYNFTMINKMIRQLTIKARSFYVRYVKDQRNKGTSLQGADLWDIYEKEVVKMMTSKLKKQGVI